MGNKEKAKQLGMPHGTATGRLRKSILFVLLELSDLNYCYQCGKLITSEKELSIEHIVPWLHTENPIELFFDLDNIAFSHLSCNVAAGRKGKTPPNKDKQYWEHGESTCGYKSHKCRCDLCKKAYSKIRKAQYKRTGK